MFRGSRAQDALVISGVLGFDSAQQQPLAGILQPQPRVRAVRQPAVRQQHAVPAPADQDLLLVRHFAVENDVGAVSDAASRRSRPEAGRRRSAAVRRRRRR